VSAVRRHIDQNTVRVGLFNSRSVTGKSANIQQWITDNKLSIAALTETWQQDAASPDLIVCAPRPALSSSRWRAQGQTNCRRRRTTAASGCSTTPHCERVSYSSRGVRRSKWYGLRTPCRVQYSRRCCLQTRLLLRYLGFLRRPTGATSHILGAAADRRRLQYSRRRHNRHRRRQAAPEPDNIRSIAAHSVIDASARSHTRPADYSR